MRRLGAVVTTLSTPEQDREVGKALDVLSGDGGDSPVRIAG
jgi:hypothetical protein